MSPWGFGRGRGRGWGMGPGWGWGMGLGPNLFWNCRWFPWLPRWWWAYPRVMGTGFVPYHPYLYYRRPYPFYSSPYPYYGMW